MASYNGYRFIRQENSWVAQIDDKFIEFNSHPMDLEYIKLDDPIIDTLKNVKMVYITFDPDSKIVSNVEVARMELEGELFTYFRIYPTTGVTNNTGLYSAFPVVTCQNATTLIPVLYFYEGNNTVIRQEGSCIIIEAMDSFDIPRLKDRLLYAMFGIMQ